MSRKQKKCDREAIWQEVGREYLAEHPHLLYNRYPEFAEQDDHLRSIEGVSSRLTQTQPPNEAPK